MGVSENRLHPEFMAIEIGLPNDTNQPVDVFFFPRFSRDKPINPYAMFLKMTYIWISCAFPMPQK